VNNIEEQLIIKCLDTGEKFAINDVDVIEGIANKPIAAVFISVKPGSESNEAPQEILENVTDQVELSIEKKNESDKDKDKEKEVQQKEELEEIAL